MVHNGTGLVQHLAGWLMLKGTNAELCLLTAKRLGTPPAKLGLEATNCGEHRTTNGHVGAYGIADLGLGSG